ncbi:hypothetical protein PSPO01_09135 [Paraphaeosphaeria sporulosa]
MLENSPARFDVNFAGPKDSDVDEDSLKDVKTETPHTNAQSIFKPLCNFIAGGGRYMGFCLGAYLAEITRKGAQVRKEDDRVIQVDWTFSNCTTEKGRWLNFQEGAYVEYFGNRQS